MAAYCLITTQQKNDQSPASSRLNGSSWLAARCWLAGPKLYDVTVPDAGSVQGLFLGGFFLKTLSSVFKKYKFDSSSQSMSVTKASLFTRIFHQ